MMEKFIKDPDAVLDYKFDWSDWLQTLEFIDSFTVTVPTGITKDSDQNQVDAIVVWLSGGTVNDTYNITCSITTNQGRSDDRTMQIYVVER